MTATTEPTPAQRAAAAMAPRQRRNFLEAAGWWCNQWSCFADGEQLPPERWAPSRWSEQQYTASLNGERSPQTTWNEMFASVGVRPQRGVRVGSTRRDV
jgi:hypothetical protein